MIEEGKLKFEKSDGPAEVEYPFREKAKMTRQEKEAPREVVSKKVAIPKEKVPITKTGRSGAGCSLAIEGSKKKSCEPNGEEEKKMLQDLVQNLERILNKQNEYITVLREEHNG